MIPTTIEEIRQIEWLVWAIQYYEVILLLWVGLLWTMERLRTETYIRAAKALRGKGLESQSEERDERIKELENQIQELKELKSQIKRMETALLLTLAAIPPKPVVIEDLTDFTYYDTIHH